MTFHISPRRRLQSARRRAASAERRRRKMRRVKGVFSGKGHFLFLRAREKCARVCVYSLHKNDDCFSFLSCCELQISTFWSKIQNTCVSLFISLLRSIYCSQEAASLSRACASAFSAASTNRAYSSSVGSGHPFSSK